MLALSLADGEAGRGLIPSAAAIQVLRNTPPLSVCRQARGTPLQKENGFHCPRTCSGQRREPIVWDPVDVPSCQDRLRGYLME